MKKINLLLLSLSISVGVRAASDVLENSVYADNFNRTVVSPFGTPPNDTTYTVSGSVSIEDYSGSGTLKMILNTTIPYNSVMGDFSKFNTAFKSKIREIQADSVIWTLNVRHNYNGSLSGFGPTNRGVAILLAATDMDHSTASGYALVNGGETPTAPRYRLVRLDGGLTANTNLTSLLMGQTIGGNNRDFMSLKVVYIPSTNTWMFYDRIDGSSTGGAFRDPLDTEGYLLSGSVVDGQLTATEMGAFGFIEKTTASTTHHTWFDNFAIRTFTSKGDPTHVEQRQIVMPTIDVHNDQVRISSIDPFSVEVYALSGMLIEQNSYTQPAGIILPKGVYMVKVTNAQTSMVQKIVIP